MAPKYWCEFNQQKKMAIYSEKLIRKGLAPPSWYYPVLRDYYEIMKKSALKSGDKVMARRYAGKQIAFSMLAKIPIPTI